MFSFISKNTATCFLHHIKSACKLAIWIFQFYLITFHFQPSCHAAGSECGSPVGAAIQLHYKPSDRCPSFHDRQWKAVRNGICPQVAATVFAKMGMESGLCISERAKSISGGIFAVIYGPFMNIWLKGFIYS